MATIRTRTSDVVWNYIGTTLSMASGFLLLPLLLYFLSEDELGIWYVFVAISNLTMLFEFGFNPTFARNVVYCISGARRLTKSGYDHSSVGADVDYHLLKTIYRATRITFAAIALAALFLCATMGTSYVRLITEGVDSDAHWISWALFCISIFLNLYFFNYLTMLRGFGDIAAENKARTYAKVGQLGLSAVLLFFGWGLVGASLAFLANGLLLRLFAWRYLKRHVEHFDGMRNDPNSPSRFEVFDVLKTISFIAWRDGVVQLSNYASGQATTLVCSLFLSLSETGVYSVMLQCATAIYHFAGAFVKSYYPMFQSAYTEDDIPLMASIAARGVAMYIALYLIGTAGVALVVFPILPFFRSDIIIDTPLFLLLSAYLFLWNHHCIFCNFIISTNRIPYALAFLLSATAGILLSVGLLTFADAGCWAVVLGPMIAQLVYNNWRWPLYMLHMLDTRYSSLIKEGFVWLGELCAKRVAQPRSHN